MERGHVNANLVPLRYRGSREFAATHKDLLFGTDSSLKETSYRSSYTAKANKQNTDHSGSFNQAAVHLDCRTTYKADFVEHQMPVTRLLPTQVQPRRQVPFESTTTYRRDFNTLIKSVKGTPDAAGNCQPPR